MRLLWFLAALILLSVPAAGALANARPSPGTGAIASPVLTQACSHEGAVVSRYGQAQVPVAADLATQDAESEADGDAPGPERAGSEPASILEAWTLAAPSPEPRTTLRDAAVAPAARSTSPAKRPPRA